VEGDRTGDDQLVVAVLVGKRRRPERLGRQQLGVGVGDPARRLAHRFGVDVGADRPQQVAGRALERGEVDRARPGYRRGEGQAPGAGSARCAL